MKRCLGSKLRRISSIRGVASEKDVPAVAQAIDEMFRNSPNPTKTESEHAFRLSFVAMMGNVKAFILSICGAVVFAILLVSANTMAISIRGRTREVALLKTLGFTRSRRALAFCRRVDCVIGSWGFDRCPGGDRFCAVDRAFAGHKLVSPMRF